MSQKKKKDIDPFLLSDSVSLADLTEACPKKLVLFSFKLKILLFVISQQFYLIGDSGIGIREVSSKKVEGST